MLAKLWSAALGGLEAFPVRVEVDVGPGLAGFSVVGLPDTSVRESRERVIAALRNSGLEFPLRRITVNLAPADRRKEGSAFDLPIALGILAASGQLKPECLRGVMLVGELSLDGTLRPLRGALALAHAAPPDGALLLPESSAREAALRPDARVYGARTLRQAISLLGGGLDATRASPPAPVRGGEAEVDLSEVRGQANARRALEVAAAGGHNLLLVGPPGTGKTLLARALPGILPSFESGEALEPTLIHSVAGLLPPGSGLLERRPFRAPHHTVSGAGLVGGGRGPRPGEISLAHRGVLFLDELPEFSPHVLELLRQPLEEGRVTISRAGGSVTFPSRFMLVGASNPC